MVPVLKQTGPDDLEPKKSEPKGEMVGEVGMEWEWSCR